MQLIKKNIFSVIMLSAVILLLSCNKFGDLNTDPTRSSDIDAGLQLAQIQAHFSGDLFLNERLSTMETMPRVQHVAGSWSNQYGGAYVKQEEFTSLLWERDYPDKILNIVDAVDRTTDKPTKTNLNAICRVMKVYLFSRITDLYGDVPYTEAGRAYKSGIDKPKFDIQKDIYTDFFKELTEATAQMDPSKDVVTQDLFYKGDIAHWKKFANSLHLRLAMRLVKIDPVLAQKEAVAAFNGGLISNNNDICKLDHENIQNNYDDIRGNGLSASITNGDIIQTRLCNTLINIMKNNNDPRLQYIAKSYIDNPYKPFERIEITEQVRDKVGIIGVKPGDFIWDDWQNSFDITVPEMGGAVYNVGNYEQRAQLANFMIANNAPFIHLSYAEVEFLLAEANFRWGLSLGGTYTQHYNNGLEAACNLLSFFPGGPGSSAGTTPAMDAAKITKFKNDNTLEPGKELKYINTQLWIALLMNGPEAYANWRRSGYPDLQPGYKPGYSASKTIPRRFEYPLSEKVQNAENVNVAIKNLGGADDWTKRVWWDKE
jgi:hypothetical protein